MSTRRVIVAGGGRVGYRTARLLRNRGDDVVVVERDGDRCEEITEDQVATVIHGDASRPNILRQAAPEKAQAVAALTGEAGTNMAVCLLARRMNQHIRTVMRVGEAPGDDYGGLADTLVFPEDAGARVAADAIHGSVVRTLEEVTGALEIVEVQVAEGAPAAGKSLEEVSLPRGSLVVSDRAGSRVATRETVLTPGDRYIVAVEPEVHAEVLNLLRA